jgi:hypothetical protein
MGYGINKLAAALPDSVGRYGLFPYFREGHEVNSGQQKPGAWPGLLQVVDQTSSSTAS